MTSPSARVSSAGITAPAAITPLDVLLGLITIGAWSSAFPLVQMALREGISPLPLASLRYGLAALIVLPYLWHHLRKSAATPALPTSTGATEITLPRWPNRKDWPRFLVCGLLGITLYNIFLNLGEQTVSPSTASLIAASSPVICALLGTWLHRDHLSAFGWLGSGIAFSGVALVCTAQGELAFGLGTLLLLLNALCQALFTVLQVPLVRRYGAVPSLVWFILIGAVSLLPWMPQGLEELHHTPLSAWVIIGLLAIVPGILGYGCWATLVGRIGSSRASLILYGIPPAAIILTILLEGTWPNLPTLLGGTAVLGGLALTRLGKQKVR